MTHVILIARPIFRALKANPRQNVPVEGRAGFDIPTAWALASPSLNMPSLHAHWRMEYIQAPRFPETKRPFTDLPAFGNDREALIVYRSPLSYLMLNRFPYNPGHLLAIPFREISDLEQLTPEESADLMATLTFGKRLLKAAMNPDGVNVGFNLGSAAGGSIPHLHGHLVPRWNGDNNFMPVLGQTRVLPQALDQTWERLHATAATLSAR